MTESSLAAGKQALVTHRQNAAALWGRVVAWATGMGPTLRHWPWFDTLRTLRQRFRDDHLGLTAGSLTFTTLIALVPLVTVMLAVFTAFPMFAGLEDAVQKYFLQNLVPDGIAKPVMRAVTQFAAKARGMGTAGLALLVVTALAMVLTIDRTLNTIWRVRQPRPLAQRVLVYWAALTLGPLALGISLSITSVVVSASRGLVQALPGGVAFLLDVIQFALLAGGAAGLFHTVPNTAVRWAHAWAGGLFVAAAFEVAKKGLAWYLVTVPSYSNVYGAFATVPILMLWVYLGWVIVLLGAVIAAYAPSLQMRISSRPATAGWRFELALAVLQQLHGARLGPQRGLSLARLALQLRTDPLQLEPVLEQLCALDWVQQLDEAQPPAPATGRAGVATPHASSDRPRYVLLCEPAQTPLAPLLHATLLQPGPATAAFVAAGGLQPLTLAQALGVTAPAPGT
jgi:membrane protein